MANTENTQDVWEQTDQDCYVALTHDQLNAQAIMDRVRSPSAGAIVLFAGKLSPLLSSIVLASLTR